MAKPGLRDNPDPVPGVRLFNATIGPVLPSSLGLCPPGGLYFFSYQKRRSSKRGGPETP
jgi:hypothetical protein